MSEYLIKNAVIITMDPALGIIKNGYVHIQGDLIKDIGVGDKPYAGETIDVHGNIVMPGLINTHTHLPMTLFRGFADDLPLHDWLHQIWKVEDRLESEDIYWCTMLAVMESLTYGVTTVSDMYNGDDNIVKAVLDGGIRAVISKAVMIDSTGTVGDRIERSKEFYHKWEGADGRV
ncbi:MAG TPA: amidohydrolase family protein, partial [Clostridia bacterium]|nr:amidohydrolase family protein [Clostridia bacterium]